MQNNLEFNVELKDSRDVQFALEKFEELWAKGVPITKDYIEAVEKKTWLRNDITPYEIYLKTMYEFFKEEINSDKDLLADDLLPDGYMRFSSVSSIRSVIPQSLYPTRISKNLWLI